MTGCAGQRRIDPFRELIATVADTIAAHAEELTALDQAIGDGDHGLNMRRGFEAVRAETDAIAEKPLPEALKAIGTKLVMTVGGASGPLYGTLFMALGKELPDDAGSRRIRRGVRQGDRRGRCARQVAGAARRPCSTCCTRCRLRSLAGKPPAELRRRGRCCGRGDQFP